MGNRDEEALKVLVHHGGMESPTVSMISVLSSLGILATQDLRYTRSPVACSTIITSHVPQSPTPQLSIMSTPALLATSDSGSPGDAEICALSGINKTFVLATGSSLSLPCISAILISGF